MPTSRSLVDDGHARRCGASAISRAASATEWRRVDDNRLAIAEDRFDRSHGSTSLVRAFYAALEVRMLDSPDELARDVPARHARLLHPARGRPRAGGERVSSLGHRRRTSRCWAFPDTAALWIVGLGAAAALLATLSLITRKNSRHPLLLVGLVALGIMFLSWRIMPRTISGRALTRSQAVAIVENAPLGAVPQVAVGCGMYVGLIASLVLVAFGLTIVIKRASQPYVVSDADDDVE